MMKSRMFWRVLANFAMLLVILTLMTALTLSILSRIENNLDSAQADNKALSDIENLRERLNEVQSAATEYAFTSAPTAKSTFANGTRNIEFSVALLQDDFSDSSTVRDVRRIKDILNNWVQYVGNKLIAVGDLPRTPENAKNLQDSLRFAIQQEVQIQYMSTARRLVHDLYGQKIASLPVNISTATRQSQNLRQFAMYVNISLVVFALALVLFLTSSITKPIRLLKQGTQNIMAGVFEPITLDRSDELGELAANFNAMSKDSATIITG